MRVVYVVITMLMLVACGSEPTEEGGEAVEMDNGLLLEVEPSEKNGRILIEAVLTNGGGSPVELQFNTSQRLEVRLFEEGNSDENVYRSSQEMMYNQVIGTVELDPEESVTFNEEIPTRYITDGQAYEGNVQLTVNAINDDSSPSTPAASFSIEM